MTNPRRPLPVFSRLSAVALLAIVAGCNGDGDGTLALSVTMDGAGTVTTTPGGVLCEGRAGGEQSGECSASFVAADMPITLQATPAAGWRFDRWELTATPDTANTLSASRNRTQSISVTGAAEHQWVAHFVETAGDAGVDAGFDAGAFFPDSGFDAGPGDAGPGDAGPGDAGPGDAGPGDAGPGDAGPGDAGPGDAGPGDAGPGDAGPGDAGPGDAGPADAGPVDAGAPAPFVVLAASDAGDSDDYRAIAFFPAGVLDGGAVRPAQYLAAGLGGALMRSNDGVVWTASTFGATIGQAAAIAASPSVALASNATNEVYRSFDGVNWITPPTTVSQIAEVLTILWANNQFVLLGINGTGNGVILTSPNGSTWTPRDTSPSPGAFVIDVAWSGTQYVAVGTAGAVSTSTDGVTWSFQPQAGNVTQADLITVAAGGGNMVAIGPTQTGVDALHSTDGVTWTALANPFPPSAFINSVTYTGTVFLAVGAGGTYFTSVDGRAWTENPTQIAGELFDVTSDGPRIVAIGDDGLAAADVLPPLATFDRPDAGSNADYKAVAWFPGGLQADGGTRAGQYIATGALGRFSRSFNGREWESGTFTTIGPTSSVAASPSVALAFNATNSVFRSTDGFNWASGGTIAQIAEVLSVIWANNQFVLLGINGSGNGVILNSPDGTTWTPRDTSPSPGAFMIDVTWTGSRFVAVGTAGAASTSTDGVTWNYQPDLGNRTTQDVFTVAAGNGRVVGITGGPAGHETVTSTDGTTWRLEVGATFPQTSNINGISFVNGEFLALGSAGESFRSVDGTYWLANPSLGAADLTDAVDQGPGVVAVGGSGTILVELPPDALVMAPQSTSTAFDFRSVGYLPAGSLPDGGSRTARYIAVGTSGNVAVWDLDAGTWDTSSFAAIGMAGTVISSGQFVLASNGTNQFAKSFDGINWAAPVTVSQVDEILGGVFANGQFVVTSINSTGNGVILTSPDGVTFTPRDTSPVPGAFIFDVAWTGTQYIGVGTAAAVVTSPDGITWSFQPQAGSVSGVDLFSVATSGSVHVAVGGFGGHGVALRSTDGLTWTQPSGAIFPPYFDPSAVAWTGSVFVAVGSNGLHYTSTDGLRWLENVSTPGGAPLFDVTADGPLVVEVGEDGLVGAAP